MSAGESPLLSSLPAGLNKRPQEEESGDRRRHGLFFLSPPLTFPLSRLLCGTIAWIVDRLIVQIG